MLVVAQSLPIETLKQILKQNPELGKQLDYTEQIVLKGHIDETSEYNPGKIIKQIKQNAKTSTQRTAELKQYLTSFSQHPYDLDYYEDLLDELDRNVWIIPILDPKVVTKLFRNTVNHMMEGGEGWNSATWLYYNHWQHLSQNSVKDYMTALKDRYNDTSSYTQEVEIKTADIAALLALVRGEQISEDVWNKTLWAKTKTPGNKAETPAQHFLAENSYFTSEEINMLVLMAKNPNRDWVKITKIVNELSGQEWSASQIETSLKYEVDEQTKQNMDVADMWQNINTYIEQPGYLAHLSLLKDQLGPYQKVDVNPYILNEEHISTYGTKLLGYSEDILELLKKYYVDGWDKLNLFLTVLEEDVEYQQCFELGYENLNIARDAIQNFKDVKTQMTAEQELVLAGAVSQMIEQNPEDVEIGMHTLLKASVILSTFESHDITNVKLIHQKLRQHTLKLTGDWFENATPATLAAIGSVLEATAQNPQVNPEQTWELVEAIHYSKGSPKTLLKPPPSTSVGKTK